MGLESSTSELSDQNSHGGSQDSYELLIVDRTNGSVVAAKVDPGVEPVERQTIVVREDKLLQSPQERRLVYQGLFRDALSRDVVSRITAERVIFTLGELQSLSRLVQDGVMASQARMLIDEKYGSESFRRAWDKRLQVMIPSLQNLLRCFESELTVDELLQLLMER